MRLLKPRRRTEAQAARKEGFTLIEVTVGAAVIAVLAMASSAAFLGSVRGVNTARSMGDAAAFLDTTMESVGGVEYGNLLGLDGNVVYDGTGANDSQYAVELSAFLSQVDLIQVSARLVQLQNNRTLGRTTTLRSNR